MKERTSSVSSVYNADNFKNGPKKSIKENSMAESPEHESLYKLNVRNASAWSKGEENKFVVTPKFIKMFNNLK